MLASPRQGSAPSTTRKNHKETFLLSYFCMTKRRVQGGEATSERRRRDGVYQKSHKVVPALCILPASSHSAFFKQPSPSGANIASEPSYHSIATATGSKRSSADSDLPLCHVRLRRTSRVEVMVLTLESACADRSTASLLQWEKVAAAG